MKSPGEDGRALPARAWQVTRVMGRAAGPLISWVVLPPSGHLPVLSTRSKKLWSLSPPKHLSQRISLIRK